jgi:hypothetical protein
MSPRSLCNSPSAVQPPQTWIPSFQLGNSFRPIVRSGGRQREVPQTGTADIEVQPELVIRNSTARASALTVVRDDKGNHQAVLPRN